MASIHTSYARDPWFAFGPNDQIRIFTWHLIFQVLTVEFLLVKTQCGLAGAY
jgi:hypothetical protein